MLPLLQRLLQYLLNAEMTLDLEANEVEVKMLTSLASVAEITGPSKGFTSRSDAAGLCCLVKFSRSVSDVDLVDSLSSAEDCERSSSVMASWLP